MTDQPTEHNDESAAPESCGTLFVVATPIGNLDDLSPRAIATLKKVDLVLAEDTRSYRTLATRFSIATPSESYHEHNERQRCAGLIARLQSGQSMALTSDAGTPLVNDPGYHLLNAAHEAEIPVRTIPGPCSITAALAISGFEPHRFIFEGFVPPKSGRRKDQLQKAIDSRATVIFFESPYRILKTLAEIEHLAPELEVCVARELTKIHEECLRGPVAEVRQVLEQRTKIKGEIVLLIRAAKKN